VLFFQDPKIGDFITFELIRKLVSSFKACKLALAIELGLKKENEQTKERERQKKTQEERERGTGEERPRRGRWSRRGAIGQVFQWDADYELASRVQDCTESIAMDSDGYNAFARTEARLEGCGIPSAIATAAAQNES
jgi:hypothetical protein